MLKTEDIHPPKTGISVHFSCFLVCQVHPYQRLNVITFSKTHAPIPGRQFYLELAFAQSYLTYLCQQVLKVLKTEDIRPPKTGPPVHFSGSLACRPRSINVLTL